MTPALCERMAGPDPVMDRVASLEAAVFKANVCVRLGGVLLDRKRSDQECIESGLEVRNENLDVVVQLACSLVGFSASQ